MYYLQEMSRMADPATSTESRSRALENELRKLGLRGVEFGVGYCKDGCIVNTTDVVTHDPNHDGCYMIHTHPKYSSNDYHDDNDVCASIEEIFDALTDTEFHKHYSSYPVSFQEEEKRKRKNRQVLRTVLGTCPQPPQDNILPKALNHILYMRRMDRSIAVAKEENKTNDSCRGVGPVRRCTGCYGSLCPSCSWARSGER